MSDTNEQYNPESLETTTSSRSAVTSLKDRPDIERRRASELNATNLTNRYSRANISDTALEMSRNQDEERSLRTSNAAVNLQDNEGSTVTHRSSRQSVSKSLRKSVMTLSSFSNLIRKSVTSFGGNNLENKNDLDDQKIEVTYSDLNDAYKSDINFDNEDDEERNLERDLRLSLERSSISQGRKNSITIESRNSERKSQVTLGGGRSNSHVVRSRLDNPECRRRTISECGEESNNRLLLDLEEDEERAFSDTEVDNMELELVCE